jgi:dTDP-4-amino-4,6-dideoxygalactose transaminase
LDDVYIKNRQAAAAAYDKAFAGHPGLTTPYREPNSTHVFHQYTLKTSGVDRMDMQQSLMDKGVPAMIYYPVPLHMQKAYTDPRYKAGDFPVTEDLCERVISLPMHTELTDEQIDFITTTVLEYLEKNYKG